MCHQIIIRYWNMLAQSRYIPVGFGLGVAFSVWAYAFQLGAGEALWPEPHEALVLLLSVGICTRMLLRHTKLHQFFSPLIVGIVLGKGVSLPLFGMSITLVLAALS